MQIILASASPRRRQLIGLLGLDIQIRPADVDELTVSHPDPAQDAIATALLKVRAVAAEVAGPALILGVDTNVALDGDILNKPIDAAEARAMLRRLRGRVHQVNTGYALLRLPDGALHYAANVTDVTMRPYSDGEIDAYIATGDPFDKAGAYAIQHPNFRPVAAYAGCYAGIMGLPLCEIAAGLRLLGARLPVAIATPCQTAHCWQQAAYDPAFTPPG